MQKYPIFTGKFKPNFSLIKNIFLLGYPIGMQFGAELSAMTMATYFMGYYGTTALTASQIVSQYSMLVVMVILGLSQAVTMGLVLAVLIDAHNARAEITDLD